MSLLQSLPHIPRGMDRNPPQGLRVPVDQDSTHVSEWMAPPLDETGPLELIDFTITPVRGFLGRRALSVTTGEHTFTLRGHGRHAEAMLPHQLRVVRTGEGVVLDDSNSPLDLIHGPSRTNQYNKPAVTFNREEQRPFEGEWAWLSEVPTLEEVMERSHTFEDFARRTLRPRIPRTKPAETNVAKNEPTPPSQLAS